MQLNHDTDIEAMSYEQAYAELEEIVDGLETNQKPLAEALSLYERGQALVKHCSVLLEKAELKIRQVSEQANPDEESF